MNTVKFNKYNTKMVAHRGVSKLECENTVPAFVAAGNRSYYGIETDVHITEDGKFILHHDDTAYRLTGIENLNIEQSAFDHLRSIPLISPIEGDEARKDLRMPALEEYISVCRKYEKFAVLELKNPMPDAAIEGIVSVIRDMQWLEQTIFISFDLNNMLVLRKLLPEQKLQYLVSKFTEELPDILKKNKLDLDIHFRALTKENIDLLHKEGIEVNCWTVDDPEDAEQLASWGVDYITSNILE